MVKVDVSEILDFCDLLPTIDTVYRLNRSSQTLKRLGRRYSYIFVSSEVRVFVNLGSDQYSLDFTPGWNSLCVPDGSKISTQGDITVLHRATDIPLTF